MTMVMFTAIALVRERERGNIEMLIATPVSPWELTIGKVAAVRRHRPGAGDGRAAARRAGVRRCRSAARWCEVYSAALLFIVASLALGMFISTLAKSQFQAMQMAFFTFLPQILLSGFMFPYRGMPVAAQWIAEVLPLTHFMRLVRGIMLRGAGMVGNVAVACGAGRDHRGDVRRRGFTRAQALD